VAQPHLNEADKDVAEAAAPPRHLVPDHCDADQNEAPMPG
jgi:hypothetical protein